MRGLKRWAGQVLLGGALTLLAAPVGCDDASDPVTPAPEFTLTDTNADSPTYDQARALSEARGRVIVLHFVLHS